MAASFGLPKQEMIEAAAKFGIIGKEMGKSTADAADFGIAMVKAAVDASSINDTSLDVALEKIRSGLAGQSRPLKDFGVFLDEANVKIEATRLGLGALGRELTQGEKIQSRASLITKKLGYSVGDLERTQDSAMNQMRKFSGQIENISTAIGTALLPVFQNLLIDLNKFIGDANRDWFDTVKSSITQTMFVARNLGTVFQIAGVDIQISASRIMGVFDQIKDKWLFLIETIKKNPMELLFPKLDAEAFGKQIFGGLMGVLQGGKLNAGAFVPNQLEVAAAQAEPLEIKDTDATKVLREMRADLEAILTQRALDDLKAKGVSSAAPSSFEKDPEKAKKPKKLDLFYSLEEYAKKLQLGASDKDKAAATTAKSTEFLANWFKVNGPKLAATAGMGAITVGVP